MAEPATTGERIKALRRSRHLTQMAFAQKLRVADSYISLIESGKRTPSKKLLKKIADFFHVPVAYLQHGNLLHARMTLSQQRTAALDSATRVLAHFFAECSPYDRMGVDIDTRQRYGTQVTTITLIKEPAGYLVDLPAIDPIAGGGSSRSETTQPPIATTSNVSEESAEL